MANLGKISTNLPKAYNMDPEGKRSTWDKVYAGYVKDNKDVQHQGRLLVYIPELCGTDREEGWIVCDYGSPFSGVTPTAAQNAGSGGQTSYGMWFVPPDVDNQVLVVFVNGDPNRGVWIACLPHVVSHRMTPALPGSSPTTSEARLNSSGSGSSSPRLSPDQQAARIAAGEANALVPYSNRQDTTRTDRAGISATMAQIAQQIPPSNSLPGAPESFADIPFSVVAVGTSKPAPATPSGGPDPRTAPTQERAGTSNIPALGNPTRSSHNSYDVNGISTPGGNRLLMSDAEGETQIRLATRNNIQVILHNDTGILSLMTGDGKSRVELHRDGKIYIYGESNINIRSKQDVNIHGDNNVNIQAGNKVQIKGDGGMLMQTGSRGGSPGSTYGPMPPVPGNMHFYSNGNIHMTSVGEHHRFSNGHMFDTSVNKINRFANFGILDTSNGDIETLSWKTITQNAREELNLKSGGKTRIESTASSVQVKAATTLTLFSTGDTHIKSDAKLNLQSKTQSNWLSGKTLNLQGKDGNVNIRGGNLVVIGPQSIINQNTVPDAGAAGDPELITPQATEAEVAVVAKTPDAVNTVEISPNSRGAGGGGGGRGGRPGQTVTSSITSELPGAEPDQSRFVGGPGYSNTNTIEIDETQAANVRIGQIAINQATPLQTLGFISSGATIGESGVGTNNLGLNSTIYEAVQAIQRTYPKAVIGSTFRSGDTRQHGTGNAVDFTLDALSQTDRASLLTEIATGIRSGEGPYRFIRGVGMYDVSGNLLHIDSRPKNSSRRVNGMDVWGPSYSIADAVPGKVPNYFLAAMQISNGKIGLVPGNPKPQTPAQPGTPAAANSDPLRWIGTAYEANGAPRYRQEPLPDYVFKVASSWSLSEVGLTDIKNFETLRGPRPADLTGKQFRNVCDNADMIGYGHKLTDQEKQDKKITVEGNVVDISDLISEDDAFKLLKQDVKAAESAVKSGITVPINQQQFDALVDFCWNIGEEKFKASDLFKFVNERKYNVVTTEFIKWCKACGSVRAELQSRRRANALKWSGVMRPETPVSVSSAAASGQAGSAASSSREAEAMAWFQSAAGGGFTREQAAGIVGNLIIESRLRPEADNGAVGIRENARGIAQWTNTGGRRLAVERFLGVSDVRLASFQDQLRAITWELNGSAGAAGRALRSAATVDEATTIVYSRYEVASLNLTGRKTEANRMLSSTRN